MLGVLIADEVVAALEGELLVAPDEVFDPGAAGNGGGCGVVVPWGEVLEEVGVESWGLPSTVIAMA